jgi:hypothetical protein
MSQSDLAAVGAIPASGPQPTYLDVRCSAAIRCRANLVHSRVHVLVVSADSNAKKWPCEGPFPVCVAH